MTYSLPELRSRPTLLAGFMSLMLLPFSPTLGLAQSLPADGTTATARLEASPRHGE